MDDAFFEKLHAKYATRYGLGMLTLGCSSLFLPQSLNRLFGTPYFFCSTASVQNGMNEVPKQVPKTTVSTDSIVNVCHLG